MVLDFSELFSLEYPEPLTEQTKAHQPLHMVCSSRHEDSQLLLCRNLWVHACELPLTYNGPLLFVNFFHMHTRELFLALSWNACISAVNLLFKANLTALGSNRTDSACPAPTPAQEVINQESLLTWHINTLSYCPSRFLSIAMYVRRFCRCLNYS